MRTPLLQRSLAVFLVATIATVAVAQQNSSARDGATENSEQLATILELNAKLNKLHTLRAQGGDRERPTMEGMLVRQDLLESIQAASLDVDSVLADIANERGQLADLRFSLQSRRDRTVSRWNAAALLTGSGVAAAVSATQFTTLSSRTQNIGDAIGIGSGVASTIFAVLAVRKQAGPRAAVGETPNMLAPLLDRTVNPVLSTAYPVPVVQYLRTIPAGGNQNRGTRIDQLVEQWERSGRLDSSDATKRERKIAVLSTSMDSKVTISIDELADRIAMLTDVSGRVSLMKRDLAVLLRSCSTSK